MDKLHKQFRPNIKNKPYDSIMIMPYDLVLTGLATQAMSYIEFLSCVIFFAECSNISKDCGTGSLWKRNVVFF